MFLITHSSAAQQRPPDSSGRTCETFVKEFYAWYLPIAQAEMKSRVDPLNLAQKARPAILSRELIQGLEAVDAEARKAQDPGLDFDPVLNSQDPGGPGDPPYQVRDVKVNGSTCKADVYYQARDGKTEKIVIPELRSGNGRWIFTNFHYPNTQFPESADLISMIKSYLKMSKQP